MTDISVYQETVRRLTAENKALKEELAEVRRTSLKKIRTLEAQLNEGLSSEVIALRNEVWRSRDLANAAVSRLREMRRSVR